MSSLSRLLREPLLHLFIAGAGLFAAYEVSAKTSAQTIGPSLTLSSVVQ